MEARPGAGSVRLKPVTRSIAGPRSGIACQIPTAAARISAVTAVIRLQRRPRRAAGS